MKKEKVVYRYFPYSGKVLQARREIPFEMRLTAQMVLDELCFNWNKKQLEAELNSSIDKGNKEKFKELSEAYMDYIWE
ncbi:IDEAL domain-containing protein [Ornithinibacillus halophilus]|uniref:IDEAL domain-containing protein n=1 Tax=Ornithinibacillus halophilus TaxID=930117 RepID=A0A1M5HZM7_9BACI|nr:IDEAL domain-containing protein [Ornithinibacillus halophilus]SHG21253.1 IDEAL domain-containing protein [Ornithinibacillus halophilus]